MSLENLFLYVIIIIRRYYNCDMIISQLLFKEIRHDRWSYPFR